MPVIRSLDTPTPVICLPLSPPSPAKQLQILVMFSNQKCRQHQIRETGRNAFSSWVHLFFLTALYVRLYQILSVLPPPPPYQSHNVGIRALLCLFFICFFIALLLHQSVTVRDFGILLPRGRGMAQKLYNQLIITIYTRNTSHSSNGTLNFV